MNLRLVDNGESLSLGGEIARGGEGVIYSVSANASSLAKIYLKEPSAEKIAKVTLMRSLVAPDLTKISAWPTELIAKNGKLCGFLMPRIAASADVHKLYSPKSRSTSFPEADLRFLIHVAANISRAFGTIHAASHVIGDINHGHVLVGTDGRVALIDADSFQITANGYTYTCDVGSPLFTPPELQNRSFRGLVRTPNHDLFGLAVLLFHILFMGRHPFSGVWLGRGEMPIEKAIQEGRFAYGISAERLQMRRPPGTLSLNTYGNGIAALFEKAFSLNSARPTAVEWAGALGMIASSLRSCIKSTAHFYPQQLGACPWCSIEGQGIRLFGGRRADIQIDTSSVDAIWRAILNASRPAEDPVLPMASGWQPPSDVELSPVWLKPLRKVGAWAVAIGSVWAWFSGQDGGGAIALFGVIGGLLIWPRVSVAAMSQISADIAATKRDWEYALDKWGKEASVKTFDTLRASLSSTKVEIDDLPNERQRRLVRLRSEHRDHQRRKFLDRFRIDRAKITGIGSGRAATLASFGIETALDVNRAAVSRIPGFGPTLTGSLLDWRQQKEGQFRYNPHEPIDPSEIARVEAELTANLSANIETLRLGAIRLQTLSRDIPYNREKLLPALQRAWGAFKLAEERAKRS
jgi:DNA-binding helix-hairpin-helix protein with protein kinase domain